MSLQYTISGKVFGSVINVIFSPYVYSIYCPLVSLPDDSWVCLSFELTVLFLFLNQAFMSPISSVFVPNPVADSEATAVLL